MRIALVLPGFSAHPDDWAIPALQNLARHLAAHHDLHIFSQRYPAQRVYQFDGFTHYALGAGQHFGVRSLAIWLQTARAIIAQHRRTPFEVLHAFWADEAGFSATLAGAIIKRPVVVSLGGGELTYLPAIDYGAQRFLARRLTTRFALKRAKCVTTGSTYQLGLCRQHRVPDHKLRLAPLGVDTSRFEPNFEQTSEAQITPLYLHPPSLIQVASLLPVKNQTLLLQVLQLVKHQLPNITLHLVGTGPSQKTLAHLACQLDIEQNIIWHKQVPYAQLPGYYHQAYLYVQTSRHESQGMAVLEGMACGVPVIGTPVGVVPEVACRAPQRSATGLAAQVVEIIGDEANYFTLRQQARQTIENSFSMTQTTQNFVTIYGEVKG